MERVNRYKVIELFKTQEGAKIDLLDMVIHENFYGQTKEEVLTLYCVAPLMNVADLLGYHLANDLKFRNEWGEENHQLIEMLRSMRTSAEKQLEELHR